MKNRLSLILMILVLSVGALWAGNGILITELNGPLQGTGYARTHHFPVDAKVYTIRVSEPDTSGIRQVKLEVSVNDLKTGNPARTAHMQVSMLDRKQFPYIYFNSSIALGELTAGRLELPGTLEINGVSNPHTVVIDLQQVADKWRATGSFHFKLTDFDLPLVGMGPMKLVDKVDLELDVTF